MEMISPEMLSTEETMTLVMDVLRRASHSTKLAALLSQSDEFKSLAKTVKHQNLDTLRTGSISTTAGNENYNYYTADTAPSTSGRMKKQ